MISYQIAFSTVILPRSLRAAGVTPGQRAARDLAPGVAHLGGYVWTTQALYRAQRIARNVPGVTAVKDEMQLERAAQRGGGDGGGAQ